jgi:hypothetical protein
MQTGLLVIVRGNLQLQGDSKRNVLQALGGHTALPTSYRQREDNPRPKESSF